MHFSSFIFGSTFPLSLIRRRVQIEPRPIDRLRLRLHESQWESFWGHANTIAAANRLLGIDITPKTERPALSLSKNGLPMLNNRRCQECWILSPDYIAGFRPAIGEEVSSDKILGWQVLRLLWQNN